MSGGRLRVGFLVLVLTLVVATGYQREARASYAAETFSVAMLTGITDVGLDLGSRWEWGGFLGFKLRPEWTVGFLALTSTKEIAGLDLTVSHLGVEGTWHAAEVFKRVPGFFAGPRLVLTTVSNKVDKRVRASTDPGVGVHLGYDFMVSKEAVWSLGPDLGWIHVFGSPKAYETFHYLLAMKVFL
jgi:hypothetical protein